MKNKINISYQCFDIKAPLTASHIRKCIAATLEAEGVNVSCEINVLITDDVGIHGINLASRQIDRPTDVLSFPMFQFEPGNPPTDWENTRTRKRSWFPWAICASPWREPLPRPRSSATASKGKWAT